MYSEPRLKPGFFTFMNKKAVVLIDGGYLRVIATKAGKTYDPTFIERFAHKCKTTDEDIFRVLYYDCAPYQGTQTLPVSGAPFTFAGSDLWLKDLAKRNLFAVRRGVLKFRGYKPRATPIASAAVGSAPGTPAPALTDADFYADFEQKGVDMRIGLDIAAYSANRSVDRIVLVSNDTDCVPAMKYGRKAGLQVVIVQLPQGFVAPELLMHADFRRKVAWP